MCGLFALIGDGGATALIKRPVANKAGLVVSQWDEVILAKLLGAAHYFLLAHLSDLAAASLRCSLTQREAG